MTVNVTTRIVLDDRPPRVVLGAGHGSIGAGLVGFYAPNAENLDGPGQLALIRAWLVTAVETIDKEAADYSARAAHPAGTGSVAA